ncbi:MAG: DUF1499 domain-containing protein [Planctomycetota bacterium]
MAMTEEAAAPAPPADNAKFKRVPLVAAGVIVALYGLAVMFNASAKPATEPGVTDGRLAPCPDKPNCVCSHADADDAVHAIDPLTLTGDPSDAIARLRDVIDAMPRTSVVEQSDTYLRVEFKTLLMRYVDDVECLLDADAGVIHIRSASRVGYSDLGANRKRVEAIRAAWEAAGR